MPEAYRNISIRKEQFEEYYAKWAKGRFSSDNLKLQQLFNAYHICVEVLSYSNLKTVLPVFQVEFIKIIGA
jgi:hypothetical protein